MYILYCQDIYFKLMAFRHNLKKNPCTELSPGDIKRTRMQATPTIVLIGRQASSAKPFTGLQVEKTAAGGHGGGKGHPPEAGPGRRHPGSQSSSGLAYLCKVPGVHRPPLAKIERPPERDGRFLGCHNTQFCEVSSFPPHSAHVHQAGAGTVLRESRRRRDHSEETGPARANRMDRARASSQGLLQADLAPPERSRRSCLTRGTQPAWTSRPALRLLPSLALCRRGLQCCPALSRLLWPVFHETLQGVLTL